MASQHRGTALRHLHTVLTRARSAVGGRTIAGAVPGRPWRRRFLGRLRGAGGAARADGSARLPRRLWNLHDAEDASQATFLILAKRPVDPPGRLAGELALRGRASGRRQGEGQRAPGGDRARGGEMKARTDARVGEETLAGAPRRARTGCRNGIGRRSSCATSKA